MIPDWKSDCAFYVEHSFISAVQETAASSLRLRCCLECVSNYPKRKKEKARLEKALEEYLYICNMVKTLRVDIQ